MCTYNSAHHVWMVYSFNCPSATQFDKNSQKCATKPKSQQQHHHHQYVSPITATTTTTQIKPQIPFQTRPTQPPPPSSSSSFSSGVTSNPGLGTQSQLLYMKNLLAQKAAQQALANKGTVTLKTTTTLPSVYNRIHPETSSTYSIFTTTNNPNSITLLQIHFTTKANNNHNNINNDDNNNNRSTVQYDPPPKKISYAESTEDVLVDDDDEPINNIGVIRTIASRIAYLAQAIQTILTSFETNSNLCDDDNIIVKLGSDEHEDDEIEIKDENEELEDITYVQTESSPLPPVVAPKIETTTTIRPPVPLTGSPFNVLDYYNRIKNGLVVNSGSGINLATTPQTTSKLELTTPPPPPPPPPSSQGNGEEVKM